MSASILIRCPECKRFIRPTVKACICGQSVKALKLKDWYLRLTGRENPRPEKPQTWVRVGPSSNSMAADAALHKTVTQVTESRWIDRDQAKAITLAKLQSWYTERAEFIPLKSSAVATIQLTNIVDGIGQNMTVAGLSEDVLSSYRATRLRAKIKPSTINKESAQLISALNAAVRAKLIRHNPLERIKKLKENNTRGYVIDEKTLDLLLTKCSDWLRPLVECGYFLPMRQAELLGLTWDQVDLEAGVLTLYGQETKSGEGRKVPLHKRAKQALESLKTPWAKSEVFRNARGKPLSRNTLTEAFSRARALAKLHSERWGWFHFHDLRHCAVTNLSAAGTDARTLQYISGHKTRAMSDRYDLKTPENVLGGVRWGKD